MEKQELVTKRNPAKWRLSGYTYSFKNSREIFTPDEFKIISQIRVLHKELLDNWDSNSRKLGLKVPEHRCHEFGCRNKVIAVDKRFDFYTCKKHKDNSENWELINKKENE